MKLYKAVGALAFLLLAGCASRPPVQTLTHVGTPTFFSDASLLKATPDNQAVKVYTDPQAKEDSKGIRTLYIAPVKLWLDPTSEFKEITDEDVTNITTQLRQAYQDDPSHKYLLVDTPAAQSLTLQMVLTHVKLTKDRTRLVSFTPIGLVVKGIKHAAEISPINIESFGVSAKGTSPTGKTLFMIQMLPTAVTLDPEDPSDDSIRLDELPARLLSLGKELRTKYAAN